MTKRLGTDKKGFVVTEPDPKKIKEPWKSLVKETINELKNTFPKKLHSIYIYGSVSKGKAKLNSSDLDLTVVMKKELTKTDKKKLAKIAKNLEDKYPFTREVGFDMGTLKEALKKENYYSWGFWLKHGCACIYGKDLGKNFPKFKPSKKIGKAINGDVKTWISKYKRKINLTKDKKKVQLYCQQIMKKIIRTAFCLVMEEEKAWVTDNLDLCVKLFVKHYPKQRKEIKKVLVLSKNPISDKKKVILILNGFGTWISDEVKSKLH